MGHQLLRCLRGDEGHDAWGLTDLPNLLDALPPLPLHGLQAFSDMTCGPCGQVAQVGSAQPALLQAAQEGTAGCQTLVSCHFSKLKGPGLANWKSSYNLVFFVSFSEFSPFLLYPFEMGKEGEGKSKLHTVFKMWGHYAFTCYYIVILSLILYSFPNDSWFPFASPATTHCWVDVCLELSVITPKSCSWAAMVSSEASILNEKLELFLFILDWSALKFCLLMLPSSHRAL